MKLNTGEVIDRLTEITGHRIARCTLQQYARQGIVNAQRSGNGWLWEESDLPTIAAEIVETMGNHAWGNRAVDPTPDEIRQQCEAIRQARPRHPVGYIETEYEIPTTTPIGYRIV